MRIAVASYPGALSDVRQRFKICCHAPGGMPAALASLRRLVGAGRKVDRSATIKQGIGKPCAQGVRSARNGIEQGATKR